MREAAQLGPRPRARHAAQGSREKTAGRPTTLFPVLLHVHVQLDFVHVGGWVSSGEAVLGTDGVIYA